jgi:hypothetical protein
MKAQMLRIHPNKCFFVVAGVIAAVGCASSTTPTGSGNPGVGATGPTGSGDGDAGATGSTAGGDDAGPSGFDAGPTTGIDSSIPTATAVPLPFYVSDQFQPTGFMGDSTASMMAITLAHDATTCKTPRQTGAGGDCFTATWAPNLGGDAGAAWAGVYWQSPANNWGAKPGKAIAAGASKVSFYAAGAVGGEQIQLCAGGINASGATAALPYGDTFTAKQPAITLTTDWTQYEISLQGTTYTTVLGGFCWVAAATATESVTFYIDDIQWQ